MTDRRLYAEDGTTVLNEDPADTTALYVDGSYGDVALAPTFNGSGFALISGTGAVTLSRAFSGNGFVLAQGSGAVTLGVGLSGAGTADGGSQPVVTPAYGHIRWPQYQPDPKPAAVIAGTASISILPAVSGHGYANDDELVLLAA